MIAKHIAMRSLGKSDFADLANYITDQQGKTERLGQVRITNMRTDHLESAIGEVLATQHINTRAQGDKTYHLLVSFRPGENLSREVLEAVEERICAGLGFADHQRISAVHHDTDNLHLHIAINKIHPTRHTMHEPYLAYRSLAELCAKLEQEYGLQVDNHDAKKRLSECRATDMEQHSGIESLVSWIRRECLDDIRATSSWGAMHKTLSENGLVLRERGNGFVITATDGTMVKASTVSRDLSRPSLVARLGEFVPSPDNQGKRNENRAYLKEPLPLRINTVELYAKYKNEQANLSTARTDAIAKARRRKDKAIEEAKRSNRLRRATIKIVDSKGIDKRKLYSQASEALKTSITTINAEYAQERERLYQGFQRKPWADWLKQQALNGDTEALTALRSREAAKGLSGNTIKADGRSRPDVVTPVRDNITKKGTIIFRAGSSAIRDDGDKLQVSREITRDGIRVALNLAVEKYGNRITVNGSAEFKSQVIRAAIDSSAPITFADPALEARRVELLSKEKLENDKPRTRANRTRTRTDRGRADRRRISGIRSRTVANKYADGSVRRASRIRRSVRADLQSIVRSAAFIGKPNIGAIGRVPPPQAKNRLRTMSQLGVVRFSQGTQMLLPGDVPSVVEHQGAKPANELRRDVFRPGGRELATSEISAMNKYIAERETKRRLGYAIPEFVRYTDHVGSISFAGIRNIDGQALVLLKRTDSDPVMVLPIDADTAKRLSKVSIGGELTITPTGSIKTSKGRGR